MAITPQTIAAGSMGAAVSALGTSIVLDIDTNCRVIVHTTRATGDTALKPLFITGVGTGSREINGPCSIEIATRAGRRFQVECVAGSASIAFED
jgi:hypothetical protein